MFAPLKKGTLLIVSGTYQDPGKKHLFVVLNNPYSTDGLVLLASFSRIKAGVTYDATCQIQGGRREHDFVIFDSYVRYEKLRISDEKSLVNGVQSKLMEPNRPVKDALYQRISAGVFASPFAAPKHQRFLRSAFAAGC